MTERHKVYSRAIVDGVHRSPGDAHSGGLVDPLGECKGDGQPQRGPSVVLSPTVSLAGLNIWFMTGWWITLVLG